MRSNPTITISLIAVLAAVPVILSACSIEYQNDRHYRHASTYWTHGEPSSDSDNGAANRALARAVRDELEQTAALQDENIGVEANDGDITLRGRVHSTAALTRAIHIARSARGVNEVESRIVVRTDTDQ